MRLILFLIFLSTGLISMAQKLVGKVVDMTGNPLPLVAIGVANTDKGTYTDENGDFEINLDRGSYRLVFSMVGFVSFETNVQVNSSIYKMGKIQLREDLFGLDEVVVTGSMTETFLKASPVKVEVITSDFIKKNMVATNMVESMTLINGLQEVVACGVCYTNSISINGLPGPYTAVLIDGMPIYGNLSAVYGLNGIPASIIDRIEVIKGPSSTLYGSEAMAGVINIITKDPSNQPRFSIDWMGTSHWESFSQLSMAIKKETYQGSIGFDHVYINDFDDWNKDGFGDVINLDRYSLFSKWNGKLSNGSKWSMVGKLYYEDRRNGVEEYLQSRAYRNLRGSSQFYGESIYTSRAEWLGSLQVNEKMKWEGSFSKHIQDSYYGSDSYQADQTLFFSNLTWNEQGENHDWLFGLTFRQQWYDDNTVATENLLENGEWVNEPENQFIPGLFIQDEWEMGKQWKFLSGLRLDFHRNHGLSYSPRLSFQYKPGTYSTIRLNSGTGFKVVNLFTEDHAFITGQREVVIEEDLLPERSINTAINFNHVYATGESQGMIDLDVFYTYFGNKILPDYSSEGEIRYGNSKGHALNRGISASINHQFVNGLSFTLGLNRIMSDEFEPDVSGNVQKRSIEYSPEWSAVSTVNYNLKTLNTILAYTVRATGPMILPEVYDLDEQGQPLSYSRPTRSEPFAIHNFQSTTRISKNFEVYMGIQNLTNHRQKVSPLIGYNDPNANPGFSQYFDTSYAYSSLHGRELYLGLRWKME